MNETIAGREKRLQLPKGSFEWHPQEMMQKRLFCAMMGFVLACCMPVVAQEKGYWRAASSTAQSITGDVAFSNDKLSINFSGFVIANIRSLHPGEVSAIFDADSNTAGNSNLYRLNIPAAKKFLHKNSLCGSEDTQWMVTYIEGRTLHIAFFSGREMPVFTLDAIKNSTNLCGTFSYVR